MSDTPPKESVPLNIETDEDVRFLMGRMVGLMETFPRRFDRLEQSAADDRAAADRRISSCEKTVATVKDRQNWLAGAHAATGIFIGYTVAHIKGYLGF